MQGVCVGTARLKVGSHLDSLHACNASRFWGIKKGVKICYNVDKGVCMPRLDGLKEDLGYLKFCFGIVVATFLALVGWIATNYTAASVLLLVCAFVSAVIFAGLALFINAKMRKIIDEIYQSKKE